MPLSLSRTYVIHAGSVISTKQPYRVVVTLFDTSRAAGVGGRLDAFIPRALPAAVAVRLSNKGSVIAEEMRESYADTTVSVSFKVLHNKAKNPNLLLSQAVSRIICSFLYVVVRSFQTTTPSSTAFIWRWRAITTADSTDRCSSIGDRSKSSGPSSPSWLTQTEESTPPGAKVRRGIE